MEHFAQRHDPVDMSLWLTRYGLRRRWRDLLWTRRGPWAASITYMPWALKYMYTASQMIYKSSHDGVRGTLDVVKQAEQATHERWTAIQQGGEYLEDDMLTALLNLVQKQDTEGRCNVVDVVTEILGTIWAGSDTTATTLASVFYHLHKNPEKLQKLQREIELAFAEGLLSYPIRFTDARRPPYPHAVVKESMRIHPSIGFGLPREVPPEGADVNGTFVPGNSDVVDKCPHLLVPSPPSLLCKATTRRSRSIPDPDVTVNPNAVHCDPRAFGGDACEWIPERWQRDPDETKKLERAFLGFGHGPRICIGKNITETEMYKLLPTILRNFDFEPPVDHWIVWEGWFHRPSNLICKVKRRRREAGRPQLVRNIL